MKRFPRPQGLTMMSKAYQQDKTKENKKKLRKLLFYYYTNNQLLCMQDTETFLVPIQKGLKELSQQSKGSKSPKNKNKRNNAITNKDDTIVLRSIGIVTIEQLSIGLGLSVNRTLIKVEHYLANRSRKSIMSKGYQEVQEIRARVGFSGLLKKSEDFLMGTLHWTDELKAIARINGYNAMQVQQANGAIANSHQGMKLTAELYQRLLPAQVKVAVQNNNYTGNNEGQLDTSENGMLLTAASAIQLLEDKGLTQVPLDTDALALIHGLNSPDIPNIAAIPSDAQGIKAFDIKELQYNTHETRREAELGLDPKSLSLEPNKSKKAKKNKLPITIHI